MKVLANNWSHPDNDTTTTNNNNNNYDNYDNIEDDDYDDDNDDDDDDDDDDDVDDDDDDDGEANALIRRHMDLIETQDNGNKWTQTKSQIKYTVNLW